MSLKNRVWIVTLIFAAVGSHFLRAQTAAREFPISVFTFSTSSSDRLMNGTKGSVRAVYSDAEHRNFIGIDYCHNHFGMYPDLSGKPDGCSKTIPLADMQKGTKVIKIDTPIGYVGTALEIEAPGFDAHKGGQVKVTLGYKMRYIGKNKYRSIPIDLVPNSKDVFIANYKGGFFSRINLTGWATLGTASGGLDTIELTTGPNYGNRVVMNKTNISDLTVE